MRWRSPTESFPRDGSIFLVLVKVENRKFVVAVGWSNEKHHKNYPLRNDVLGYSLNQMVAWSNELRPDTKIYNGELV